MNWYLSCFPVLAIVLLVPSAQADLVDSAQYTPSQDLQRNYREERADSPNRIRSEIVQFVDAVNYKVRRLANGVPTALDTMRIDPDAIVRISRVSFSGGVAVELTSYSPPMTRRRDINTVLPLGDPYYDSGPLGSTNSAGRRSDTDIATLITDTSGYTVSAVYYGLEDVTVPAGTFTNCLRVDMLQGDQHVTYWYAPDIGKIRQASDTLLRELVSWNPL